MAIEAARVTIPVTSNANEASGKFKELNKRLRQVDDGAKQTNKSSSMLGKTLKLVGGALVTGALIRGFKALVNVTEKQQRAEAQLNAVIKSTDNVAGVTAEGLKGLASSLQKVTTYGDEAIIGAESLLLTFTKIGGDVIPGATEAVLNMSAALGQDLKQSSIQVGKALNDPIMGITALRRVGVQLSADQENLIKQFMAVGDVASAQGVILGELETQFGGAAEAASKTLGGALQQLKNATGDAFEKMGNELTPGVVTLSKTLLAAVQDGGVFVSALEIIGKAIGKLAQGFAFAVEGINIVANYISFKKAHKETKNLTKAINELYNQAKTDLGLTGDSASKLTTELYKLSQNGTAAQKEYVANFKKELRKLSFAQQDAVSGMDEPLNRLTASQDRVEESLKSNTDEINSLIAANQHNVTTTNAVVKSTEDYAAVLSKARDILAKAGDANAFLESQRAAFAEQVAIVQQAGLETAALEKFQLQQRKNQLEDYLTQTAQNEDMSFKERRAMLEAQKEELLSTENLTYEERLAAQQAYNVASQELERQRLQSFAHGVAFTAQVLGDFGAIANSLGQTRRNMIEQEINDMEASGASEEKIAKRRAELARKAAKDQKNFSTFSVILDTSVAITKTLAEFGATPVGISLAALAATKGAAELAAIQSQPLPTAAFGGKFRVPPGNEADSGLLRVSSDEEVSVTPAYQSSAMPQSIVVRIGEKDFKAYVVETAEEGFNSGQAQITRKGAIKTA